MVTEAMKELANIEASVKRLLTQVENSSIEPELKDRILEDLKEVGFEVHHLAPVETIEAGENIQSYWNELASGATDYRG